MTTVRTGNTIIVDASVAAKWFFDEEQSVAALRLLSPGNQLHGPDLLPVELHSVLVKRIRRGDITREDAEIVRAGFVQFPVRLYPTKPLLEPAYEMAIETGRSLYDCLYTALAMLLDGVVVTADRRRVDGLRGKRFERYVVWLEAV